MTRTEEILLMEKSRLLKNYRYRTNELKQFMNYNSLRESANGPKVLNLDTFTVQEMMMFERLESLALDAKTKLYVYANLDKYSMKFGKLWIKWNLLEPEEIVYSTVSCDVINSQIPEYYIYVVNDLIKSDRKMNFFEYTNLYQKELARLLEKEMNQEEIKKHKLREYYANIFPNSEKKELILKV